MATYRVEIYDQTSKPGNDPTGKLAIIDKAFSKKLVKQLSAASQFTFTMPYLLGEMDINALVERNHVKVFKNGDSTPLFDGRIITIEKKQEDGGDLVADVYCESMATTLAERIWPARPVFDGPNSATDVISQVLTYQSMLSMGNIEPTDTFVVEYAFDSLMQMIWRIPSLIGGDLEVDCNRQVNYYTEQGNDSGVRLTYGLNLMNVAVNVDTANIVTRLYGLGSGNGTSQIDASSVNGGKLYVDSPNISKYGVIEGVLVDSQASNPTTLLYSMKQFLAWNDRPLVNFSVKAAWLAELAGYAHTKFDLGDSLILNHKLLGIVDEKLRVVKMTHNLDYDEDIDLEFGNVNQNISNAFGSLQQRLGSLERY